MGNDKKHKHKKRELKGAEYRHITNKKRVTAIYIILRVSVVLMMVAQIFNRNFENVFLCLLTLVLFMLPSVIERRMRIDLPDTLEVIILLFIYAAEIMGEIQEWYLYVRGWDKIMHTMNGFLCAAIGFSLVNILNKNKRIAMNLSPFYVAVMAFCFSMTVGVLWEFFERGVDMWFGGDMQKDTILTAIASVKFDPNGRNISHTIKNITDVILVQADGTQIPLGLGGYLDIGLVDTMMDLFVNFIGAVVFSVIGYFYLKHEGKGKIAPKFIPQMMDKIPAHAEDSSQIPEAESGAAEEVK